MDDWGASGEWGAAATDADTAAAGQPSMDELLAAAASGSADLSNIRKGLVQQEVKDIPPPKQAPPRNKSKLKVELGFVEEPQNPEEMDRKYFPSKVGGKPGWLCPKPLPPVEDLSCAVCQQRLNFLLQVYCPLDDVDHDNAFHRMLYIFCCANGSCHSQPGSIRVLRCQLPRVNPFYSSDPPPVLSAASSSRVPDTMARDPVLCDSTCIVCGQPASQACAKCHAAKYCSRTHQTLDWTSRHKKLCPEFQSDLAGVRSRLDVLVGSKYVFKQMELLIEEDTAPVAAAKDDSDDDDDDDGPTASTAMGGGMDMTAEDVADLESTAREFNKSDKTFLAFQTAVNATPDQVLRYSVARNGETSLHISTKVPPSIPHCGACGGPRVFEMQVMPQLLFFLDQDETLGEDSSLDFGTLLVFTCAASCTSQTPYVQEHVWREMPDE
eukprot:c15049_g1_i1.p1 GENE.c15049_g1_i1~~c15049_g1_i1.p1  ORF type:complete len:452 (+),score=107.56 c15049_g1_i1:44-1357(+)